MGKTALLAVGGGSLSAAAVLAALAGSPMGVIAAYLAPLPLLVAGLALGSGAFGFAAAAGLAVAVALGGFTAAGLYGGMHVIPTWLIVQQALRPRAASADGWQPIGSVLAALTLLVGFVVTATAWAGRGDDGIEAAVRTMLTGVMQLAMSGLDETDRQALVGQLTPVFPGFSGAVWLTTLAINAVAAQSIVVARGWNRRPRPRWSDLCLPAWFEWILAGAAVVGLTAAGDVQYIARNLVVILLTPYFLVGLAVVHAAARRTSMTGPLLVCFYIVLLVFFLVAAALVAALGVVEQWFGVRRRLTGGGPPERKA